MEQNFINYSQGDVVKIKSTSHRYTGLVLSKSSTTVELLDARKHFNYFIYSIPILSIESVEVIGNLPTKTRKANLGYIYKQLDHHRSSYNKVVAIIENSDKTMKH